MNSIKKNYRIDINDSISLDNLIDSWSPYKTVASLLLWKSIEEKYFYV
jgi:3-methyladenine DNA glycosylase/8-oxoguanine DNA glycosylase